MKYDEIKEHWEYSLKIIELSKGVPTIELCEYLYREAMKHGVKHEQKPTIFELDIMKLETGICSICVNESEVKRTTCASTGCEEFQHFMYRDM